MVPPDFSFGFFNSNFAFCSSIVSYLCRWSTNYQHFWGKTWSPHLKMAWIVFLTSLSCGTLLDSARGIWRLSWNGYRLYYTTPQCLCMSVDSVGLFVPLQIQRLKEKFREIHEKLSYHFVQPKKFSALALCCWCRKKRVLPHNFADAETRGLQVLHRG